MNVGWHCNVQHRLLLLLLNLSLWAEHVTVFPGLTAGRVPSVITGYLVSWGASYLSYHKAFCL